MLKYIISVVFLTLSLYANNYDKGDEAYEDGDIKTAISFWEKGSIAGESDSQFMLGFLYLRGDDIAIDTQKAASLLAKTFNKNDETILITIALAYYKNTAKDAQGIKSIKQFEEAIDKEGSTAQYNLGMLFLNGTGVDKDVKKGKLLIKKSKKK